MSDSTGIHGSCFAPVPGFSTGNSATSQPVQEQPSETPAPQTAIERIQERLLCIQVANQQIAGDSFDKLIANHVAGALSSQIKGGKENIMQEKKTLGSTSKVLYYEKAFALLEKGLRNGDLKDISTSDVVLSFLQKNGLGIPKTKELEQNEELLTRALKKLEEAEKKKSIISVKEAELRSLCASQNQVKGAAKNIQNLRKKVQELQKEQKQLEREAVRLELRAMTPFEREAEREAERVKVTREYTAELDTEKSEEAQFKLYEIDRLQKNDRVDRVKRVFTHAKDDLADAFSVVKRGIQDKITSKKGEMKAARTNSIWSRCTASFTQFMTNARMNVDQRYNVQQLKEGKSIEIQSDPQFIKIDCQESRRNIAQKNKDQIFASIINQIPPIAINAQREVGDNAVIVELNNYGIKVEEGSVRYDVNMKQLKFKKGDIEHVIQVPREPLTQTKDGITRIFLDENSARNCDYCISGKASSGAKVFVGADGNSQVEAAQKAATQAASNACTYGESNIGKAKTAQDVVRIQIDALVEANEKLEGIGSPERIHGSTTLSQVAVVDNLLITTSIGDSQVSVYRTLPNGTKKWINITSEGRITPDPKDAGGHIGGEEVVGADWSNLRSNIFELKEGDIVFWGSDGVYENFLPQTLGIQPNEALQYLNLSDKEKCALCKELNITTQRLDDISKVYTWDGHDSLHNHLSHLYQQKKFEEVVTGATEGQKMCEKIANHLETVSFDHKKMLLQGKPVSDAILGKPDHANMMVFTYKPEDSRTQPVGAQSKISSPIGGFKKLAYLKKVNKELASVEDSLSNNPLDLDLNRRRLHLLKEHAKYTTANEQSLKLISNADQVVGELEKLDQNENELSITNYNNTGVIKNSSRNFTRVRELLADKLDKTTTSTLITKATYLEKKKEFLTRQAELSKEPKNLSKLQKIIEESKELIKTAETEGFPFKGELDRLKQRKTELIQKWDEMVEENYTGVEKQLEKDPENIDLLNKKINILNLQCQYATPEQTSPLKAKQQEVQKQIGMYAEKQLKDGELVQIELIPEPGATHVTELKDEVLQTMLAIFPETIVVDPNVSVSAEGAVFRSENYYATPLLNIQKVEKNGQSYISAKYGDKDVEFRKEVVSISNGNAYGSEYGKAEINCDFGAHSSDPTGAQYAVVTDGSGFGQDSADAAKWAAIGAEEVLKEKVGGVKNLRQGAELLLRALQAAQEKIEQKKGGGDEKALTTITMSLMVDGYLLTLSNGDAETVIFRDNDDPLLPTKTSEEDIVDTSHAGGQIGVSKGSMDNPVHYNNFRLACVKLKSGDQPVCMSDGTYDNLTPYQLHKMPSEVVDSLTEKHKEALFKKFGSPGQTQEVYINKLKDELKIQEGEFANTKPGKEDQFKIWKEIQQTPEGQELITMSVKNELKTIQKSGNKTDSITDKLHGHVKNAAEKKGLYMLERSTHFLENPREQFVREVPTGKQDHAAIVALGKNVIEKK